MYRCDRTTCRCDPDPWARIRLMAHRAVFLDLNGTLVEPILVNHPRELMPVDGASAAVARLCAAGFICPVVTVQSRIEKGIFTESDFLEWFERFRGQMAAAHATLAGPYVCPHRPRTRCECAKPSTVLYERAATQLGISLVDSFVIGDTENDVEAARRFGGKGCLIGPFEQSASAHYQASTLSEAADWILARSHPLIAPGSARLSTRSA